MIKQDKLIKFGRKAQIMEISDNLQVNDFYDKSGVIETNVHGKFSRIGICIVDTKEGKKENAHVCEFKLTDKECKKILSLIVQDGDEFKRRVVSYNTSNGLGSNDYISIMKVHHFKADKQGKSPVFQFKMSYESGMKSSKWKVNLEKGTGKAVCNEQSTGAKLWSIEKGTYKKECSTNFFLTDIEILELKTTILRHIDLWERCNYEKMLTYREEFYKRAKENNFNEETINMWNSKENSEGVANKDNGKKGNTPQKAAAGLTCSCGNQVSKAMAGYTQKVYGEILCQQCKVSKEMQGGV